MFRSRRTLKNSRIRKLMMESMEPRQVMAAYISEIHFDPLFGNEAEDQYIELRGAPNSTLDNGTYLVVVCAADGVWELGDVHAIFDLSRAQFGANGMMVIMQSGGGYTVDPQARLLKGTDGFLGIGNDIFRADGNSKQFRTGSNNFFLIQSAAPPSLNTDIDADDNGLPDGAYVGWTILDSVGVLPFYESAWKQRSYAQITFREDNVGLAMPGSTSVESDQLAYVARINRSTGFAPGDWVAGNTVEVNPTPSWRFQLQHGVFGTPRPFAYGGRFLDNIGSENWIGGIAGTVFQDDNKDGVQQIGESGISGVTVQASLSGDTTPGVEVASINPDNYPLNTDVSNALPYVTIISAGADNVPQGFKIRVVQRSFSPAGDYIFAHEGVGFFYEDRRMRMDFYHPARGVSIDVIGNSDQTPTYGRLELFNSNNESLGFVRTQALGAGKRERLTLSSAANDVAWALAYSDNTYLNSSSFGMLENLEVVIPEKSAVTDAKGNYVFPTLPSGSYSVKATPPNLYDVVFPTGSGLQSATIVGNELITTKNFGLQGNRPPVLDDQVYSASELTPGGTVLATLPVTLGYSAQRLSYTIVSGDPAGIFTIDAATGKLILNSAGLDFETRPSVKLSLKLEDTGSPALNDTALIEILVEDRNEAPSVDSKSATLSEFTSNGAAVATMSAVDPDAGLAGSFAWSILSGNTDGAFSIDATTGAVSVQDATKIDFERNASHTLVIRATDKGAPALSGDATLSITMIDVNEAPILLGQALTIKENSVAGTAAGTASATDPDRNQQLQWQIVGGSGSALFDINATNGEVRLKSGSQLNFEQATQYQLDVKVTDSGTPALSVTRTINVLVADDNDVPSVGAAGFSFAENAAEGLLVGTVQGSDEDAGQTLRYSLSGADAANFTIDEATGAIRTIAGKAYNFEAKSSYLVLVTATDSGEQPRQASATITIQLTNVNEAPVVTVENLNVAENSAAGVKPGSITAQDEDAGDVLRWTILSQSQNWVGVNEATGELTVLAGAVIDFEGNKENVISIRVTDTLGASSTRTITLTATDRNDPPTTTTPALGNLTAKANNPFSYTLPASTFVDVDAGDSLNVFVTLASGFPLPGWLSYNSSTRVLSGTPTVNDGGPVNVRFTAIDKGGASAVASLSVEVDANQLPWHNTAKPLDVTADGNVTARDALLIINYLNVAGPGSVPTGAQASDGFFDTSGDNSVSARDVLLVINDLNLQAAGEGESAIIGDSDSLVAFDLEELNVSSRRRR